jgi:hypothetical protein
MEKYELSLSGEYILQCVLDEDWVYTKLDLYTNMANIPIPFGEYINNKNVFPFSNYQISSGVQCIHGYYINYLATYKSITIHNKLPKNNKTLLDHFKYIHKCNTYRNILTIKNGKLELHIDKLQNIMNRTIIYDFLCKENDIHNMTINDIKLDYERKGFTFDIVLGNYIYYSRYCPVIMFFGNDKFTIFNKMYCTNSNICTFEHLGNNYSFNKILNYNNCFCNCPITKYDITIRHYHTSLDHHNKSCIIIQYTDSPIFRLHKILFEEKEIDEKYKELFGCTDFF